MSPERQRIQIALSLAFAGLAGGIVLLAVTTGASHVRAASATAVLDAIVVWSFAIAGAIAWLRRPGNRTGPLMVWAGLIWFLSALQVSDTSTLFTIGLITANLPV